MAIARKRPDTGAWEVAYHYRDEQGRHRRKRKGFGKDGQLEAERFAAAIEARNSGRGFRQPSDPHPLDRVLPEFVAVYRETWSRSYEQTAVGMIRNHLVPYFGDRELRDVTERDALAFAAAVLGKGCSPHVVRNCLSLLRRVMNVNTGPGRPLRENPLRDVGRICRSIEQRHETEVRQVDAWTLPELWRVLELAREHEPSIYPLLVFLSHTGARRGEALGLRWPAVDFERRLVTFREAVVHGHRTTPKSGKARSVPLDAAGPLLLEVLGEIAAQRRTSEPWKAPELVFPGPTGKPLDEGKLGRVWRRLSERFSDARVRPLRLHDFRHTFATHALQAGASVKQVQLWLGHQSAELTMRVYAHVIPEQAPKGFLQGEPNEVRPSILAPGRRHDR